MSVITVTAGHSNKDPGAVNGLFREADIAQEMRNMVASYLRQKDIAVKTDGEGKGNLPLPAAIKLIAGSKAAVEFHCNAFSNPMANGTETYSYYGSIEGGRLAAILQEELLTAGGLQDRGAKEANLYVLKHSSIPASLVELAFISNEREEALLTSEDFQNKMAFAIAKGLSRFFVGE